MTSLKPAWRVFVPKSAQKAIARVPADDARRVTAALHSLAVDPFGGDLRDLGDRTFRRRVGAYRIRFEVDMSTRVVTVLGVERRTSTTHRKR